MDHHVPSRCHFASMQPYDLAHPAPDPVASYGRTQGLLDAPSEAANRKSICSRKHGKFAAGPLTAFAIDSVKIGFAR